MKICFVLLLSFKAFASNYLVEKSSKNFDIDPRKYGLVFSYIFNDNETDLSKKIFKFKFPKIKFYGSKSMSGNTIGEITSKGLYLERKKVCYFEKLFKGEYDLLVERRLEPKDEAGARGSKIHVGERTSTEKFSARNCSFLNIVQTVGLEFRTALVLEGYDEDKKVAKIRLGKKIGYFSTKSLPMQAVLRPALAELDHYSIDPIKLIKKMKIKVDEFRVKKVKYLKSSEPDSSFVIHYGLVFDFDLSSLDWMDRYGAKKLKDELIKVYGETTLIKFFDFQNMTVNTDRFKNSAKGKADIIYIRFEYPNLGGPVMYKNLDKSSLYYKFDVYYIPNSDFGSAGSERYIQSFVNEMDWKKAKRYFKKLD